MAAHHPGTGPTMGAGRPAQQPPGKSGRTLSRPLRALLLGLALASPAGCAREPDASLDDADVRAVAPRAAAADAAFAEGDFERAAVLYVARIEVGEARPADHLRLAVSLRRSGRPAAARAALDTAERAGVAPARTVLERIRIALAEDDPEAVARAVAQARALDVVVPRGLLHATRTRETHTAPDENEEGEDDHDRADPTTRDP